MEKIAKTQLIDAVAQKASLTKKESAEAITVLLEEVVSALKAGKTVGLPSLGTLSITETKERTGVKPGTTEKITIAAGKKIRFKAASNLLPE
ncbi:HU family DNA-binding protein [Deinococcus cellulosilyticus]|uniref:Uncharacterized protein n=1 Tax=Deinococcus cellulosilyticus (strain DSM 18568 / NBRC 106333 / KACC 11606 / 5516J-15) TaxID=1223518 RepID=A0A511NBN1_DEIC1|nr:HU family DNA-binding protein [Deinococcus cellulosilyticus]GEM49771.1 hypothetical protein DC3_54060 [Deinococcus cellulosilyticus NBRC 106333 = KACC 11606]